MSSFLFSGACVEDLNQTCGDGVMESGESCDGTPIGITCGTLGFYDVQGTPTCRPDCTLDTSDCGGTCGDGILQAESGELCDGTPPMAETCTRFGLFFGSPGCDPRDCRPDAGTCRDLDTWGAPPLPVWGSAVAVDAAGSIYTAGLWSETVYEPERLLVNRAFLTVHNSRGERTWTRFWNASPRDSSQAHGVAVDGAGNVFITGVTDGHSTDHHHPDRYDMFLLKTNPWGTIQWVRQFGSANLDVARAVAVDSTGGVYVTGSTSGSLDEQPASGQTDMFLVKFDSLGNHLWTRQVGNGENTMGNSLVIDPAGEVVVAGTSDWNLFLARFDPSGQLLWIRGWGPEGFTEIPGLAMDQAGDLYVTGYTKRALPGQSFAGESDAFLVKFDSQANPLWFRQWGSAGLDAGVGVVVDGSGVVHVAGNADGPFDGQEDGSDGGAFLIRFDAGTGARLETHRWGADDRSGCRGLALDSAGHAFVIGGRAVPFAENESNTYSEIFLKYIP